MKKRWRMLLYKGILPFLGLCFMCAGFLLWVKLYGASVSPLQAEVRLFIPPGSSFVNIKKLLSQHQVVQDDFRFDLIARFSGKAALLKAGDYVFQPGLSHNTILAKLANGDVYYSPVTIPEGANKRQVSQIIANALGGGPELLELIHDQSFISSLGLNVASLEGYLFPDTYFVTRGQTHQAVLAMMVSRFKKVYAEITAEFAGGVPAGRNLSRHQVVTLASIIEKETAVAEERPLIAAVFLNRLNKKMKLQADPTVIYGIEDFNGNLTRKDLQTPSPYNTYTKAGLPEGPIGNPGRDSIRAVFYPAQTSYLYFVAQGDGKHYFSTTLKEHNRAVRRYQKR